MDGFFSYLIAGAVVLFYLIAQSRKSTAKSGAPQTGMPTFGGQEPDATQTDAERLPKAKNSEAATLRKKGKANKTPTLRTGHEGHVHDAAPFIPRQRDTGPTPQTAGNAAPLQEEKSEEASEYALKSADDVRKAIVWSEILRRKYE